MSARDLQLPVSMIPPRRPDRRARMVTTRTGITIGAAYIPPPQRLDGYSALLLQDALLEPRTADPRRPLNPAAEALRAIALGVWRWL